MNGRSVGRARERKRKREKETGREGEMNFPFPSSGLCGQYCASICLLSSASTVDAELGPSWLPLCPMQKVNMAHNGVGLVPKGS